MASNSEVTFGARLNNASTLHTHLLAFKDYAPSNENQTAAALLAAITPIKAQNSKTAGDKQAYSSAVEKRQKLFKKDPDSLLKLLSPLGAAVRSIFTKTSKEAADIAAMIVRIRGVKIKKDKAEPTAESVSQSEKSFGSMTQTFADIIATCFQYCNTLSIFLDNIV